MSFVQYLLITLEIVVLAILKTYKYVKTDVRIYINTYQDHDIEQYF